MAPPSVDFATFSATERALGVQANRLLQALCRLPAEDSLEFVGWETEFYGEIVRLQICLLVTSR